MIWPKTASRTRNSGDKPHTVGVDTAKDDISSRLSIVPADDGPTARAIHFPALGLSADYFQQLTSEHAVVHYDALNKPIRKWVKKSPGARNEAWDCMVLALAARMSLPARLDPKIARIQPASPQMADAIDETEQSPDETAEHLPVSVKSASLSTDRASRRQAWARR